MGGSSWWSRNHIDRRAAGVLGLILLAVVLEVAAGVGLAYVAGFGAVRAALDRIDWPWLAVVLAALTVSFAGYYSAYRGIYQAEGGYELGRRQHRAVVVAGFGGLFSHGGKTPDDLALRACGAGRHDALVRVWTLGAMEQGVLALIGCLASITAVFLHLTAPPSDFTLPWVIIPLPAALLVFWAAERFRKRLRHRSGWLGRFTVILDSIHLVRKLFAHPLRNLRGLAGMTVFWAADVFAVWAALAAFGVRMDGAALIVGFCTGMVFTRRVAPLAGAGTLTLVLTVTLWVSGAPLAAAIAGVFAYRLLCLWLPLPFAVASLPALREMSKQAIAGTAPGEPAEPAGLAGPAGPADPPRDAPDEAAPAAVGEPGRRLRDGARDIGPVSVGPRRGRPA